MVVIVKLFELTKKSTEVQMQLTELIHYFLVVFVIPQLAQAISLGLMAQAMEATHLPFILFPQPNLK